MSLTLYTTSELLGLPPPTWLIDGIFPERGFVALYGKPGTFKTFVALDMALAVALGRPWQGHATKPGPVVYVSAEGGVGIGKRVQAWLNHYGVKGADMLWLLQPITLSDGQPDIDELVSAIAAKMSIENDPNGEGSYLVPSLVVVDTLARCFLGDENLQEDMGNFVRAVDRLREEFHAAVLVIHHAGLNSERERGSTAFRGAADTVMRVDRDEKDEQNIVLSCDKQKDSLEFEPIDLQLQVVDDTDSCVIVPRVNVNEERQAKLMAVLLENGPLEWFALCEKAGLTPQQANYPLQLLKKEGKVQRNGKIFTLKGE